MKKRQFFANTKRIYNILFYQQLWFLSLKNSVYGTEQETNLHLYPFVVFVSRCHEGSFSLFSSCFVSLEIELFLQFFGDLVLPWWLFVDTPPYYLPLPGVKPWHFWNRWWMRKCKWTRLRTTLSLSRAERGRSGDVPWTYWKQMMEKDLPRTVVTYNSLLSSNLEWQQAEKLLKDLQKVLQVSIISYNSILNVYGQSGCWESALLSAIKLERRGMHTELLTQNTVATACERCKQWRTTLAILVSIQKERSKVDAFSCSTGINACGRCAKWRKAIDILQTFGHRKVEANVVCQSAAIAACERSGQWQLAMELLAPVQPNLVMCNAALSACAEGAQWQLTLELLVSMRYDSLQADVISYNSLSLACAVAGHWQTALSVVEVLESMDLQRNAQSYGILLFCHSSTSHWQDALCLPLQDLFRDIVCCTSAIGACASAEQWQRALHLLQESYHQQLEVGKLNSVEFITFVTLSQHITIDRSTDDTVCVVRQWFPFHHLHRVSFCTSN